VASLAIHGAGAERLASSRRHYGMILWFVRAETRAARAAAIHTAASTDDAHHATTDRDGEANYFGVAAIVATADAYHSRGPRTRSAHRRCSTGRVRRKQERWRTRRMRNDKDQAAAPRRSALQSGFASVLPPNNRSIGPSFRRGSPARRLRRIPDTAGGTYLITRIAATAAENSTSSLDARGRRLDG
jgi:hypothetical protein